MASGPEHYAEGERLLQAALNPDPAASRPAPHLDACALIAAAQAHFTAAVAAGTALRPVPGDNPRERDRWHEHWHDAAGTPVRGTADQGGPATRRQRV